MAPSLPQNRKWLLVGGALTILLGIAAMIFPGVFSMFVTQLIGAFLFVGGALALGSAIFDKGQPHRWLAAVSAVIRIAAGWVLFIYTPSGLLALTLVLAIAFTAEGVLCIVGAFGLRANPGWIWVLLNGVAALVLAGLIYVKWPADAAWVIGLLFGIQSIFSGSAFLMLGIGMKKT